MTRYPCDMAPVIAALGQKTAVCPECGQPFTMQSYRHKKGLFCSPRCSSLHRSRENDRRRREQSC